MAVWIGLGAVVVVLVVAIVLFMRRKPEGPQAFQGAPPPPVEIRKLNEEQREHFRRQWSLVEQHAVDRPTLAVVQADEVIAEVMRAIGYPLGKLEEHAPAYVVEEYRAARSILTDEPGTSKPASVKESLRHYRALFEEMVGR